MQFFSSGAGLNFSLALVGGELSINRLLLNPNEMWDAR